VAFDVAGLDDALLFLQRYTAQSPCEMPSSSLKTAPDFRARHTNLKMTNQAKRFATPGASVKPPKAAIPATE